MLSELWYWLMGDWFGLVRFMWFMGLLGAANLWLMVSNWRERKHIRRKLMEAHHLKDYWSQRMRSLLDLKVTPNSQEPPRSEG